MIKRSFLKTTLGLACATAFCLASAQTTPIKLQLDWRFEGPSALFLVPAAKGYFKDAKLDVTVDAGNGSGGAVTRVASGSYDLGFADLAALMEFHANNPDAPNKPVAVMMVYNNTPASVMALKKSGIKTPGDLAGKKMGAPVFDAGRRAFPIFAKANEIGNVTWTAMDPPLRETMLVRGDVDAITGFTFTSLLNIEARGVKAEDVVVLQYPDYGVKLYGNAVLASRSLIEQNPKAVAGMVRAINKALKDAIANPAESVKALKERDGMVNEATEIEFFRDVRIGSAKVRKGRYTLYAIPSPDKWTLIINKENDTWGAFQYDVKKDLLRVELKPEKNPETVESFSLYFDGGKGNALLTFAWDDVMAKLPISW